MMNTPSLEKLEELVSQGYLRKSEKDDLVLYGYTDQCTFDKYWTPETRQARGLILNKHTGEIVARPFPKFFNLGEMPETFLANLPNERYTVQEKMDGSLGILFYHNNDWQIATRGSFYSEQAIVAKEILDEYYDKKMLIKDLTYLVEIIYPENKIIVNYGKEENLTLLAAINTKTGFDYSTDFLEGESVQSGMPMAPTYILTIEEMIELQKTLPKDSEGFVVRFESGLRVKIKGDEYMKMARLLSRLSPISLWECMKDGKVQNEYLEQLPEEFHKEYEPIREKLEQQYCEIFEEIQEEFSRIPINKNDISSANRKELGLYLVYNQLKHSSAMFPLLLEQYDIVDKYVMKQIRPNGNELRE